MSRPEYELLSKLKTQKTATAKTNIRLVEEEAAAGETAAAYQYFRDQTGRHLPLLL